MEALWSVFVYAVYIHICANGKYVSLDYYLLFTFRAEGTTYMWRTHRGDERHDGTHTLKHTQKAT